ncbi:protein SPT2 homolog [Pectinophora gossypiella]|uniref:protein SPT2 homolog n=1 Tax=Pectinophora gossypiella TaxID=13191 RepID=UPI00214E3BE2|nr:protein SPT2 homolog [Pectinophora gossypiella]
MYRNVCLVLCACAFVRTQVIPGKSRTNDGDFNFVNTDGSFDFGYANKDNGQSYHLAHSNAAGVVGGRFGAKDPATNTVKETVYTAGPRGFRAKGPNVHRKMDLDQRPRGPIGNKDDPYFDPNEDPSYSFKFDTRTYSKNENADSRGDVKGHYSFVDDVGERHEVSYIAGRDTGFHVSSAHPDSPNVIGSPFHRAPLVRGETRPRGRTAVQRGLDGSYRFISAGPDQRRTESSDSHGNVRGSYTFLDDKGVQRTVHYIAGPGIGYRIVKGGKDPYIPAYFPTIPSKYDPDFVSAGSTAFSPDDSGSDDVFKRPEATAASGHVKPPPFPTDKDRPGKKPTPPTGINEDDSGDGYGSGPGGSSFESDSGSPSFGSGPSSGFGSGSGSSRPEFGSRPGSGSGSSGSNFGSGSSGSNFGSGSGGSGSGSTFGTGTSGPGASRPPFGAGSRPTGSGGSNFGSGSGSSSFGPGGAGADDSSYVDEDASSFGDNKPTKGPGKPGRHPSKPYRPTKKPYVPLKPFQTTHSKEDEYDESDDKNTPQFGIGFDIQKKPGVTTIYKPGTTIIRNIGQDYFGVPPGVSVRAHVQSIDLYPFDSKPISPSEAIEKDKT